VNNTLSGRAENACTCGYRYSIVFRNLRTDMPIYDGWRPGACPKCREPFKWRIVDRKVEISHG
jgi:hypothetical protein